MKRVVIISGVTLIAVAITSVSVFAATNRGQRQHMSFDEIDANGDGQISQTEMQTAFTSRMEKIDADSDGFLTQAELEVEGQKRVKQRAEHMMDRFDADGDGKIALADLMSNRDPSSIFERIDADSSGTVSQDEFDEAHKKRMRFKPKSSD